MNSLIASLQAWDGVHTQYLMGVYAAEMNDAAFFKGLIASCASNAEVQIAATWLIKHHYDNGNTLDRSDTEKLVKLSAALESWEAKLHVLQLLPHFKLSDETVILADDFARECLTHPNKFVRAWAYQGLFTLTKYMPEMKRELAILCQGAMETESAAIKAKVRKILLALAKSQ